MAPYLVQSSWRYPYDTYDQLYLENRTAKHYKFYEMKKIASGQWMARWGKIGTNGHTLLYDSSEWGNKLTEKMKKRYILERATSSTAIPNSTPPPIVTPQSSDATFTDAMVMRKLDRIILFLDDKGKHTEMTIAENIKVEYISTGLLTKSDMKKLNEFWQKNGGGHWVE